MSSIVSSLHRSHSDEVDRFLADLCPTSGAVSSRAVCGSGNMENLSGGHMSVFFSIYQTLFEIRVWWMSFPRVATRLLALALALKFDELNHRWPH